MNIRNFAIIAHIDHGKSTLADRLLEQTGVVKAGAGEQLLDTMELERERGITIKLNPVRMSYCFGAEEYQLNLIDTPGHVDFGYEVSRSLAAVEGVVLLVDAVQGVQAQTLSNYYQAKELGLAIIPAVNKIDLPNARVDEVVEELVSLLNCSADEVLRLSAKTGQGTELLLREIVRRLPPPKLSDDPTKALVFDSFFDPYLGVVAYVRVMSGEITSNSQLSLAATRISFQPVELGYLELKRVKQNKIVSGEIGYVATGLKNIQQCRVGDTIIADQTTPPLAGYQTPRSMVFASFFPEPGKERELAVALEKLKLTDAALHYEPINSQALGLGFSVGFLGLLHLEIIKERIEREYDITVLATTPTVAYQDLDTAEPKEPWVLLEIVTPTRYYGQVVELISQYRCLHRDLEYFGERVVCRYFAPLAEIIADFYDRLKSVTSGYASMDYQFHEYRSADLVAVDLLIMGEKIDALRQYMVRERSERYGQFVVRRLKELIPRQNFEISIQAAISGRIIARADVPAYRKDVTAKLYGGDVTRKRKLLEKQKKGKKRLRQIGRIAVPSEVFVELLKKT